MLMAAYSVSRPACPAPPRAPGGWGPLLSGTWEGLAVAADARARPRHAPLPVVTASSGARVPHSCWLCPWDVCGLHLQWKAGHRQAAWEFAPWRSALLEFRSYRGSERAGSAPRAPRPPAFPVSGATCCLLPVFLVGCCLQRRHVSSVVWTQRWPVAPVSAGLRSPSGDCLQSGLWCQPQHKSASL